MANTEIITIVYQELLKVIGGATLLLAGLSVFLSKIWSERIARREGEARDKRITELKAELDQQAALFKSKIDAAMQRTVHIGKLQLEHEYQIYKLAWDQLVALRQATISLRPTLDYIDPKESKEERMQKRKLAFAEPYNSFLTVIEKNKPFYPQEIYDALSRVREKCMHELIDYEYIERPRHEYFKEAMRNHEEILALIEASCLAIRVRVTEVSAP